ncbi:post-GPI attachment to proteins factor 2 isoform X2 [Pieris rapae]|uniref:post-GPI attachment to proteins factor 2 isoform X2 n=1 Tax=Pieris rapae TaxID=64459 RepID=UPI001E281A16|nr:post-GPI attachment to proteins factor 2 isoform X2 [Pieris rapae]
MYLPLHNASDRKYFIKIPITKLGLCTVSLPLFAFIVCVVFTIIKDFDKANNTHCKVPNVFPSISASIGNYEPQRTIWKTAIYIHAPLRFFIIYLRWEYYRRLTYWTSSLNYPYHEACFKTFIGTSIFYMFFTSMMLTKYRRHPVVSPLETYSVKLKWRAFFTNVGSFAFAAYFFLRHNRLCEPYVYSMFAFSEYIVVVSNILFHMTTIYDLKVQYLYFTRKGVTIE